MELNKFAAVAAAAVALASLSVAAHGGTPALSYSLDTGESLGNGPFTLGWQFQANTTIKVDGLGVFDDNLDGLAESHDVGLWDSAGDLLATATVAAGTADPLTANFRYVGITPVTLTKGTYYIGAVWLDGADNNVFVGDSGSVATLPAITYLSSSYADGGTLSNPTTLVGTPGYFGPNFEITGVPEPTTWALMLVGFGGLGAVVRVARQKAALGAA